MADAGARFALTLLKALGGEESVVCTYVEVENQPTRFLSLPVRLGKNGVEEILPAGTLSAYEQQLFDEMLPTLESNIAKGVEFANS
jgi:malate dehydrogenase